MPVDPHRRGLELQLDEEGQGQVREGEVDGEVHRLGHTEDLESRAQGHDAQEAELPVVRVASVSLRHHENVNTSRCRCAGRGDHTLELGGELVDAHDGGVTSARGSGLPRATIQVNIIAHHGQGLQLGQGELRGVPDLLAPW